MESEGKDDDEERVEDEETLPTKKARTEETQEILRRKCPYLDTISRQKLDFDQMKVCSVTLSNMNVYACLVCGKYFQGRGKFTPAYTHSVQAGHFVWINLQDTNCYCLPDSYEIVDAALNDVKRCLAPIFTSRSIAAIDRDTSLARDIYGISYLPGFVGLNNLTNTDYLNVVLHALSHVKPLRDFFLLPENYQAAALSSPVVRIFGESDTLPHFTSSLHFLTSLDFTSSLHFTSLHFTSLDVSFFPTISCCRHISTSSACRTVYADCCVCVFLFVCMCVLCLCLLAVRKLWSKDNFKSVMSPQDMMQVVCTESKRRFNIGHQAEAIDLLVWLLNELHRYTHTHTHSLSLSLSLPLAPFPAPSLSPVFYANVFCGLYFVFVGIM